MSGEPKIFHGEWWIPAEADPENQGLFPIVQKGMEAKHTGTLTYYEDNVSTLEFYHVPSNFHAKHYWNNNVIWGADANGFIYTLFNVTKRKGINKAGFTATVFEVGLILLGEHVLSLKEARYNRCIVKYPYLRNWAFRDHLISDTTDNRWVQTIIDASKYTTILEAQVGNGFKWNLYDKFVLNRSKYDLNFIQLTEFKICTNEAVSIESLLKNANEFSRFLSVALYGEQNPIGIELYRTGQNRSTKLLFKVDKSIDPKEDKLIKFEELEEKVPAMLVTWHQNYDKIAPISSYLVDSLRKKNEFNVPDFLIVAQALDGYHKRFVNKKDGKDIRKYEKQMEILLDQFKDVEAIQQCNIDPEVLCDTRNKYSHLYPDDEKSSAVVGKDLFWLTEKCKILLTCCILNMLGLSNDEINLCCKNNAIQRMLGYHPFEFE